MKIAIIALTAAATAMLGCAQRDVRPAALPYTPGDFPSPSASYASTTGAGLNVIAAGAGRATVLARVLEDQGTWTVVRDPVPASSPFPGK